MLFAQAEALHRAGRLEEAASLYRQALGAQPDHGPSLHMAGMLAIQTGDMARGLAMLEQAFAVGYRNAALFDHYGAIKLRQGDGAVAASSFRNGLALDPASGSLWFNLGVAERQAGRPAQAARAFAQAAGLLRAGFAAFALGQALQEAGQPAQAAAAYAQALALDPGCANAALNAGVIAQQTGDLAQAMARYRQALAIEPGLLAARVNLAAALQESGDLAGAAAAFRSILADAPDCLDALNNLGATLRRLGATPEAEALFRRAATLDPFHASACDNLTQLLLDTGRPAEAVARREACCAAHPDDARAWMDLARVLGRTGQVEDDALARALTCDPSLAEAHGRLGDGAQRRRDWPAAAGHYRRAARLAPAHAEPQLGLALVALKSKDGAAALAACDAALAQNRFDQRAIAYRALALRQCGQAAEADWLTSPQALVTILQMPADVVALAELADTLKAVPQRAFAPAGQSIRGGTQTVNDLFAEPAPSISQFRKWLDQALTAYLATRAVDERHPFLAARPAGLHYHSWSVVLSAAGHHVPHIHPGGCISGVFYVAVPPLEGADHSGCLEIGQPGIEVALPAAPQTLLIRPAPGRLVLFPSYLWHGTLPFAGPGERITIAFDVRHGPQPLPSDRW